MTFAQMLMWFLDVRAVLLCVFSLFALRWIFSAKKNLPPGPSGFPIVGSAPAILLGRMLHGLQPYHLFAKYAEKYGPVVHLKLFNKTMIILNDFSSIRDAFQHPDLSDRPKMLFAELTDAMVSPRSRASPGWSSVGSASPPSGTSGSGSLASRKRLSLKLRKWSKR